MTLLEIVAHPVSHLYLNLAIILFGVAGTCLIWQIDALQAHSGKTFTAGIGAVALAGGFVCVVQGTHLSNDHDAALTRATVAYVHDHNELTAMKPITFDDTGATFDAARADNSTVHVRLTWNTGEPADGSTPPAGYNPISVTVTD